MPVYANPEIIIPPEMKKPIATSSSSFLVRQYIRRLFDRGIIARKGQAAGEPVRIGAAWSNDI